MKNFKFLLFYKWICINALGMSLLFVAFWEGLIDIVIKADSTYISQLIFAVFIWSLISSGIKIWKISKELNILKSANFNNSPRFLEFISLCKNKNKNKNKIGIEPLIDALKLRLFSKIVSNKWLANSLVLLGLIGTVVGFVISLSNVDASVVSNVESIGPMVSTMINGMSIAFYTTLVGAIFHIWAMINYNMIAIGTSNLISNILESVHK